MRRAALAALIFLAACGGGSSGPGAPPPARAPSASSAWWNGAVVYQVFVRSFRDSDGDGKGDLAGLAEKLDYLNDGDPDTYADLGVDAIWLMPIFESPSDHGYDVTDYDAVEPDYGTDGDLDSLVAAAHARGIQVILDFVPNHTSRQHPWFVGAERLATAATRDWYLWSATNPGWTQPWGGDPTWHATGTGWYYGVFWDGMPDLNWKNPEVRAEMAAIAGRWLARGVDGFRLDAVRYLVENGGGRQADQPETHAALKELAASVRTARPDALVVGEAWADTATIASYFGSTAALPEGDELPLLFDFPLADAVLAGVRDGSASGIASVLDAVARAYPAGVGDAPFLSNHDQDRVATRLGADPAKLRVAASILLTLQGTPFVYYGEELGMQNGVGAGDERRRTPMAWDATGNGGFTSGTPWYPLAPGAATANVAAETGDPGSLLSRYRALIRARKASHALSRGGTQRLPADGAVVAWLRTAPGERVLAAHDVGFAAATRTFAVEGTGADPLFVDPGASIVASADGRSFTVTLPARASGVWRIR